MSERFSKSVLFLLFLFGAGCAPLEPLIQDVNLISLEEERELGGKLAAEIEKEMKIVTDPGLVRPVKSIGARLVNALPRRDFDYQFSVVEDKEPNAFTIPGGRIYVHTGLLSIINDQDELAGVLAHEIGHAYERHPTKNLSRAYGMQYLVSLLLGGSQSQLRALALAAAGKGLLLKYTRSDEREADEVGFQLVKRAGFKTNGLLRFLIKLQNLSRGFALPAFLSSHPPTPERIARLQELEAH
jgi:predicted Zn-dependent protease